LRTTPPTLEVFQKLAMKMRELKTIRYLVLMAACLGVAFQIGNQAQAQPNSRAASKVSPDLVRQIPGSGAADKRISVIIQFKTMPDRDVEVLLASVGAKAMGVFKKLNMRVVEMPLNAVEVLAHRREIKFVSPDRQLRSSGHVEATTGTAAIRVQTTSLLGLVTTTTVLDGSGIGIAVIDSGIDAGHSAFKNQIGFSRIVVNRDFTGENRTDDVYGHGTHVASLAAGNDQIADGAYTGIASNANLINLRVLNSQGVGTTSGLLAALDWVMTYHSLYNIRVINMSLGTAAIDSYLYDPLCQSVRALTDAGIVVVAAAGNNGKLTSGQKIYGQIHSPGNEPSAITVGASNSFGSNVRTDDTVTTYSSRGPTRSYWTDENGLKHYDNLLKPDLTAPGNRLVGAAGAGNYLLATSPDLDAEVSTMTSRRMMYMSGSSMAAPVAAGTAALLLQANPTLTPSLIKLILMYTAQPLAGSNMLEQGAGEINVEGATRLAKLVRTDVTNFTPVGAPLLSAAAPAPQTTLDNQTFSWAQGIILNRTYAIGSDLITKHQKVYCAGFILGDGIVETSSDQSINVTRMTGGVLLATNIVTSNGTVLSQGADFLDLSLLLGYGLMLPDGIMVGDGVMVGDGIMIGDGVMVGDGWLQPQSVLTGGDATSCMK